MTIKDFTLKKLRINPAMSQETRCFSAILCYKGEQVMFVQNEGRGGSHTFYWVNTKGAPCSYVAIHKEIDEFAKEWAMSQPNPIAFEFIDQLIDHLIDAEEELKWLRRKCKKATCVQLKGAELGQWEMFQYGVQVTPEMRAKDVAEFKGLYGDKILRFGHEVAGMA